jgi:hypothetical protein
MKCAIRNGIPSPFCRASTARETILALVSSIEPALSFIAELLCAPG